jgi:signal transduction histidine kinase
LILADDGKGMDVHSLSEGIGQGQGISNMQARARLLGGKLVLDSEPGHGLQLTLTIPCDGQESLDPRYEGQEP